MKPHRSILPLLPALALLILLGGASAARADATCAHTNAFFYTTDTGNLAAALSTAAAGSRCTDYYVSVTPATSGLPRPGPVGLVHALGPNFHVMAEIRLAETGYWFSYAQAHSWYGAGVEARHQMDLAGYSTALGDTWAINEVGAPSATVMGVDVIEKNDDARQHFEDFVAGLYSGDGTAPEMGVVFAANPPQLSTGVQQYAGDLRNWYSDAPFWEAMSAHVRAWAQETYADARAWGVAGASLGQRAARLNDYYLHGIHAVAEDDAMAAARAFFASTYTPLGNASFRYGPPDPATQIGFGDTDIGITGMLSFISSQTFALRSSSGARFGFAVVPSKAGTLNAGETASVEARVGRAIFDSRLDPLGACNAAGESCDFDVVGAAFTDAWNDMTPPVVTWTLAGELGNSGWYTGDVTLTWGVTDAQSTTATLGCDTVAVTEDTAGTTFTCHASSAGGATESSVTVKRDATPPDVACTPTPSILWPPNGRLAPVSVEVTVTDALSGVADWELTGFPSADAADFAAGTQDVAGLLRAARSGTDGDRVYALVYTAHDVAGNAATCEATVTVPHDQGG
jgi:hypothetical protein